MIKSAISSQGASFVRALEKRATMGGMTGQRWTIPVGSEETGVLALTPTSPRATLVFAHGAGGHMEQKHIETLANLFLGLNLEVVRFNFLYRAQGKSVPDRMPRLQQCFAAVLAEVEERLKPQRLLIGGHSMGGRCASMLAADGLGHDGLLLCSYPLHPPGQPEKIRDAHLPSITVPTLCLNGTEDPFCDPSLMTGVLARLGPSFQMHWLEHADHSFHVLKRTGRTDGEVMAEVGQAVDTWLR